METILVLLHIDESGNLPRIAFEALGAACELRHGGNANFAIGIIGGDIESAAGKIGGCGATSFFGVSHPALEVSRYGTDLAALGALVEKVAPTLIVAPSTSRFARVLPGLAVRIGGQIDTHITSIDPGADGAAVFAERWYYRQRMKAKFTRDARPWILVVDGGAFEPWKGETGSVALQMVSPWAEGGPGDNVTRTQVSGIETGESGTQTIRPDADLLFVAGAGWAKKQADGQTHVPKAEKLILGFLEGAKASLGSSKSLVDQSSEGQAVLTCLSHLNQVGQTGTTPRHQKGLATCCHGEEPHVVGWRFVQERRAVNLDANCGWARGKADVVYVADAFEVVEKLNDLLGV
ncbi:MAG: electron transfer flavoprotein subunit alpha [Candidatus Eisenbacteria bacterium]|uniref:Electron transfer flavoprotein subunit alpha n=1 Tax=Eiseniibacteriota bacterium TaxID=2212470 RepID=A0A956NE47_UNCEI|nr:electron transfer flavoprotein subunit alpha [Candidatus Eisenbacteria bacterium]